MIPAFLADRENRKRRGEFDAENRVGADVGDVEQFDLFDDPDDEDDEDDVVLETKGSSPPPPASPMEEARAQMELERMRAQLAAEEAARKEAQAAAERQARIDKARGIQTQAYNQASGYADLQNRARGFDQGLVDQYGLIDLFMNELNNARLGIAEDDLNPMAQYNTKTWYNDALNTAQGTYRGDLRRQLNDIAGEDFAYNVFADDADDLILQAILGQQRTDAQAQLDAARARGQLNDVGYNRALQQLSQQEKSGMADLQDLGLGVLSGYRDDLFGMRNDMLDRINTASFDNPLSFDTFQNRLGQRQSDLFGRLEGDLYRATSGQSFFDPSSIISTSGAVQGYYNPTTQTSTGTKSLGAGGNPLLDAFTTDEQNKQSASGNKVF